jgi:hypothetical protein
MSVRAQTEKSGWATGKSALPSRTDIVRPVPLVRFVPTRDMLGEVVNLGGLVRFPFMALPR